MGSSPTFGTILIIFFISLFSSAQDEEESKRDLSNYSTDDLVVALETSEQETINLRTAITDSFLWNSLLETENRELITEVERQGQNRVLNRLERLFLQRYIEPVDRWMENPTVSGHPLIVPKDGESWYVLVIEQKDKINDFKYWVKFNLRFEVFCGSNYLLFSQAQIQDSTQYYYRSIMRESFLDTLEHHLVMNLDDVNMLKVIQDSEPHLYRLTTKDTDIEKLRKEDRIY